MLADSSLRLCRAWSNSRSLWRSRLPGLVEVALRSIERVIVRRAIREAIERHGASGLRDRFIEQLNVRLAFLNDPNDREAVISEAERRFEHSLGFARGAIRHSLARVVSAGDHRLD